MNWPNKAIMDARIMETEKQAIFGGNAAAAIERVIGRTSAAAQ